MCVVNLFSSQIFAGAGINPKVGTFFVGVANALGSIVPIILIFRYGRRTLLALSFGLMFICHSLIVVCFKTDMDFVSNSFSSLFLASNFNDPMLPICLPAWSRPPAICLYYRHLLRRWNVFCDDLSLVLDAHGHYDHSLPNNEQDLWDCRHFPLPLRHYLGRLPIFNVRPKRNKGTH